MGGLLRWRERRSSPKVVNMGMGRFLGGPKGCAKKMGVNNNFGGKSPGIARIVDESAEKPNEGKQATFQGPGESGGVLLQNLSGRRGTFTK